MLSGNACASRQGDAEARATPSRAVHSPQEQAAAGPSSQVMYARGPIADLPDEHASRRERFAELDDLQPGWQVELCSRGAGSAFDAIFYSPSGELIQPVPHMLDSFKMLSQHHCQAKRVVVLHVQDRRWVHLQMHVELHCNTASSKAAASMHREINAEVLGFEYPQCHNACYWNRKCHCLLTTQIVLPAFLQDDTRCHFITAWQHCFSVHLCPELIQ